MSRTSVAATWYPCDASTPRWVPVGRPIRNVRTYVLDEELYPVPVGDTGQMYLAGAGLARGCLGHPGRTAASFLPDPFAERPGERMCATGDNVRLQPDGNYVYVGRIDDQIKISGYRVEIGEVEHNLRACRGVVDAAALLREETPGGAAIVAYLVGERRPDELLTSQLGSWLPTPMIPRVYVWLDGSIPHSPTRTQYVTLTLCHSLAGAGRIREAVPCLLSTPKVTSSVVPASICATSLVSRFAIATSPV
jgi:acyl-coenzyme A synthetase/AMP-(fatty) acid ligase